MGDSGKLLCFAIFNLIILFPCFTNRDKQKGTTDYSIAPLLSVMHDSTAGNNCQSVLKRFLNFFLGLFELAGERQEKQD